jgi:hypothetical protein
MEKYHQAGCESAVASAASTSTPETVTEWNEAVAGHVHPPEIEIYGLANSGPWSGSDQWGDLIGGGLGEPGSADPELHTRMLHLLAESGPLPPPPGPGYPDVSSIRQVLGL